MHRSDLLYTIWSYSSYHAERHERPPRILPTSSASSVRHSPVRSHRSSDSSTCAMQDVAVQRQVLSATLSSETQSALFPEDQQQYWEHTYSASLSQLQQALLSRAQSPEMRQHICFKPYHLSHDMLRTIAAKPHVVIIGADGGNSTVRAELALGQHSYTEEVTASSQQQFCIQQSNAKLVDIHIAQQLHLLMHSCTYSWQVHKEEYRRC